MRHANSFLVGGEFEFSYGDISSDVDSYIDSVSAYEVDEAYGKRMEEIYETLGDAFAIIHLSESERVFEGVLETGNYGEVDVEYAEELRLATQYFSKIHQSVANENRIIEALEYTYGNDIFDEVIAKAPWAMRNLSKLKHNIENGEYDENLVSEIYQYLLYVNGVDLIQERLGIFFYPTIKGEIFMFKLPSLRQAKRLVKKYKHFVMKKEIIDGKTVYQFDYLLASPKDFTVTPYAKELRGIAYVSSFFGLINETVPMLHKFHNLNECDGYMFDDLNGWVVLGIQEKDDGSVINFINIAGKFYAKSKYSFQSYQSQKAQELFDNSSNLQKCVSFFYDMGYTPIFELVGRDNPIVVEYGDLELRLIQIRSTETGNYVHPKNILMWAGHFNVPTGKFDPIMGLEPTFGNVFDRYYKDKVETLEGIEGWVFTLEHPITGETKLVKVKTKWYLALHGIMTGSTLFANNIIEYILTDTIDDVVSSMKFVENDFRKKFIDETIETIDNYYNTEYTRLVNILEKYKHMDNKEFANQYKTTPNFHVLMAGRKGKDVGKLLKESIIRQTRKKEMAETFLQDIKEKDNGSITVV
jgi:T4 RnlA family RNA ligase